MNELDQFLQKRQWFMGEVEALNRKVDEANRRILHVEQEMLENRRLVHRLTWIVKNRLRLSLLSICLGIVAGNVLSALLRL
jgi:uncharacterized protein involved in exopolysaccharide biosynthesis